MAARRRGRAAGEPDGPTPGTVADEAPDADPAAIARAIALRQLTLAPKTRAQLATAMARKGVPEDVGAAVLDRFEEVRLVDDGEFARSWVASRHSGRGLSRRALGHELRQRGVQDDLVMEAVAAIDDDAELDAAKALVRRKLPGMRGDEPLRRTRRLAGMLARKGYGPGLSHRAIREVTGEEVAVPDPD